MLYLEEVEKGHEASYWSIKPPLASLQFSLSEDLSKNQTRPRRRKPKENINLVDFSQAELLTKMLCRCMWRVRRELVMQLIEFLTTKLYLWNVGISVP